MSDFTLFFEALDDRYIVEREVGRGGMATVYLGHDRKHRRPVAIKVLRPELAAAVGAQRFLREIEFAAGLNHPHILPLYDSGAAAGFLYYVMPYVDGETLRQKLDREQQLPIAEAVRIASEVADGLHHAHRAGVIHRDIKPENIFLSGGHAVLADFGVARALTAAGDEHLTVTGLALGTPAYMSPEQAVGQTHIDTRSDLYSLACVLHEMLVGEPPHAGPTVQAVLARRVSQAVPSVQTARDTVSPALDATLRRALARLPADRYATAAEFAVALNQSMRGIDLVAQLPQPAARMFTFRRAILAGVFALAAWGVVATAYVVTAGRAGRSLEPARLAVLPFTVMGETGFEYLGEGIVDLLARNLDGAGDLRTVDPGTVLSAVGRDGSRESADRYRAVARRVGAGIYLTGSVHAIGGRLRIQASLYDATTDSPGAALYQIGVEDDGRNVLALVDSLARRLLVERGAAPGRLFETAALTTRSLPALKAYLTAEQTLRSGPSAIDSALAGFQRAVAEDSTFALAYYRLAVAAGWQGRQEVSAAATAAALRHSGRLAERDRRLLEAYNSYRSGSVDQAEQGFRDLIRDYPDDLEAEFQLADLLTNHNPIRGRSQDEARELFDRVLAYDPGFL